MTRLHKIHLLIYISIRSIRSASVFFFFFLVKLSLVLPLSLQQVSLQQSVRWIISHRTEEKQESCLLSHQYVTRSDNYSRHHSSAVTVIIIIPSSSSPPALIVTADPNSHPQTPLPSSPLSSAAPSVDQMHLISSKKDPLLIQVPADSAAASLKHCFAFLFGSR